jgi:hypothetical protein
MAVNLDLKVIVLQEDNGKSARIFDGTGVSDGTNFPYGFSDGVYSTFNPKKSEVDQVIIEMSLGLLSATVTLTGTDLSNYLDPTIGYNLNATTLFGASYERFDDGIYDITCTYSGDTVQDLPEGWEDYEEIYEGFLWQLWGKIRAMATSVDVPIRELIEPLGTAVANLLFDAILYNCQFGDKDGAEKVFNFLTEVVDNNTSLIEIFKNVRSYD